MTQEDYKNWITGLYNIWVEKTGRNGGVLVGKSIHEFIEFLAGKEYWVDQKTKVFTAPDLESVKEEVRRIRDNQNELLKYQPNSPVALAIKFEMIRLLTWLEGK